MSRAVGLSRPIKIEWLDKTIELINENKNENEISDELHEYLSYEIKDKTNLNKTRSSLLKTWVKVADEDKEYRDFALKCCKNNYDQRMAVHWCMLLKAYPVFFDISNFIGKIFMIQDTFKISWLKQKLAESWGDRTTLFYSIDKIVKTMKNLYVLDNESIGVYKCNTYKINNADMIELFVMTILRTSDSAYFEITDLSRMSAMFPFEFSVSHELIYNSSRFKTDNFGGRIVLAND